MIQCNTPTRLFRLLFSSLLLGLPLAHALELESNTLLPPQKMTPVLADQSIVEPVRTNRREGAYRDPMPTEESLAPSLPPFGHHLFSGGFRGLRSDGINQHYQLAPGDQITFRLWGAVADERILVVDAQGNVFIPSVGPVRVQGLTNGELNQHMTRVVKRVYPENVNVYTNLQNPQPVAVFVTGYVNKPGRYAGTPNDSLLYFLDQAGGIDDQLGSYRTIEVRRGNRLLSRIDLYDFLTEGKLPRPQFRDGDTVVVKAKGGSVVVTGNVPRGYRYEFGPGESTGRHLLRRVRPLFDTTHVLLRGMRHDQPLAKYFTLSQLDNMALRDGDELLFSGDAKTETIIVQLEGSFHGPSRYAVPRDTHLIDFLDRIAVPEQLTDTASVSLRRLAVAEQQKRALNDSLRRLESTYLATPSSTAEEAQVRAKEAELITQFVQRAQKIRPSGRLVVAQNDVLANVRLQDGDTITIPEKSDAILISGEVLVPQSIVFRPALSAQDYINAAGGLSAHADEEQILVVRRTGEVRRANEVALKPGDELLVLPDAPTKNIQLAGTLSQILYQIAIAAKVVLDL